MRLGQPEIRAGVVPVSVHNIDTFFWPRSVKTLVQLPWCHSAERACLKIQRGPSARLLALVPQRGIGSARATRCGDVQASPPWPPPKSTAAGPLSIFIQALIPFPDLVVFAGRRRTRPALSGSPLRDFASSAAVVIWPQPPPPSVPVFPPGKTG